ncbi:Glyoxalase/Bleomycin resistance protein/Dihydroxybiphenyl dioxygenase [Pyrenochaeta sp. MPI-SDFR-AT-0127]|nr:Glyoxalase/Bleomycin resistance protein/Dihydroxybiphenyl dioxygenase [Pyrenochaeta sp. MPI-SDFR-AT-0127]
MLDHFGLFVPASKFDKVIVWYDAALAPLGYVRKDFMPGQLIGMSADGINFDFWIHKKDESDRTPVHFAFRAKDRGTVDAFHAEALKAGGTCNGKPGLREIYHPNYYGAFVLDPCGNSIEAVDHMPH